MKLNAKFPWMPIDNSLSQCGRFGAKGRTTNDTWKMMSAFEIPKLKHFIIVTTMREP